MKKIILLSLLVTSTAFAGTCSLRASGKVCHQVLDGYITVSGPVTTSTITINGHSGTITTTGPSHQEASYHTECYHNLLLEMDEDVIATEGRGMDMMDQVEKLKREGTCEQLVPSNCSVKIEDGGYYLSVNGKTGVEIDRGNDSESSLYVQKLIAILRIKDLCI